MKSSLKISHNKLYLCIPTLILTFLSSNVVFGANAWLWEDSDGNDNMSWTGSGTVSGGDTNADGNGDQNYLISGITTAGGTFRINQIGGYHQGSNSAYPTLAQTFEGGASMEIIVSGTPDALVDFTVDLIGSVANPYTYRSIFDIAPNEHVTKVEIRTLFDGERKATFPAGGNFQSFALSWVNAATIGEVLTVDTEVTGISINGGNLVNPTLGGRSFGSVRTPGTSLGYTGNIYSAELDGTQTVTGNNHGIWSLEDETDNGTFRGLNVTITPNDGQFDGGTHIVEGETINDYFRYTFDGLTVNAAPVPEPSSAILIGLGGLAFILRRRR